jgi:NAD(P)-dependent dehydrogenase (short-subunit alcohol dehydrogenase family)
VHVSIAETDLADWNRVLNVNLTGVFNCLKYELPQIEDGGSIVNMASVAGLHGAPGWSAYVASKHGVVGLTKTAAYEVGERKVRVNAVCP